VLAHTRELAYQITAEFDRFKKYMPDVKVMCIYGGMDMGEQKKQIKSDSPNIVVATAGRLLSLVESKDLNLTKLKRFILDECDNLLEPVDMRRQVQSIFKHTPKNKQVLMFSATINKEVRETCKKFTKDAVSIFIDDESKLTLHGLQQYYLKVDEKNKTKQLVDILDVLEFNQVMIFVKTVERCKVLTEVLQKSNFPAMAIHARLDQKERLDRYNKFKENKVRILVSTDIWGRGIDVERVNIVVNFDMPCSNEREANPSGEVSSDTDTYLHRVNRAGRFGTKGLAISFVTSVADSKVLESVQDRFEVEVPEMPAQIDTSTYLSA